MPLRRGAGRSWRWGTRIRRKADYEPGTVTPSFLKKVARLSGFEDGPRLAKELLSKHGIALAIAPHLPRTYVDGAALRLSDGRPVIGLTLRHDRIDNFWFCLLHELAHVGRHLDTNEGNAFIDDQTLRGVEGRREDPKETQADEWAQEALVPRILWLGKPARHGSGYPTPMAVMNLARALQVHPAIVAGKIRYEKQNYRLLSQFVGTGEVRRQLDTVLGRCQDIDRGATVFGRRRNRLRTGVDRAVRLCSPLNWTMRAQLKADSGCSQPGTGHLRRCLIPAWSTGQAERMSPVADLYRRRTTTCRYE